MRRVPWQSPRRTLGGMRAATYAARVFPGGLRAMAYCRPQTVRPGDEVALHLSAVTPTVSVEVVRDGLESEVVS
jgi:hypothetical protein